MKTRRLLFLCFVLTTACVAEEEMTKESMAEGVRANLAAYDAISPPKADNPVSVRLKLGETVSKYRDQFTFDGFRITAPDDVEGRDFVWCFNAPENWANWFIVPVSGDFEGGFRNWLNADKLYRDLDTPQEKGRMRTLQTLDSGYFKPGADYILWFRQVRVDAATSPELRAVFRFAAKPAAVKEWDHDSIEKALKLKDAPDADQVAHLGSRGGRILLDAALFDKSDASGRIHDVLFNIRQTTRYEDGVFITMETSVPPCRRNPSLSAIREKYGPADFVQTAEEARKVRKHAGGEADKDDDEPRTTHYYDYFGLEVSSAGDDDKVLQVRTHANDFSLIKPPSKGGYFAQVGMKNLTVLYQDGKEAGRYYFFMEGGKEPFCIQEPPVGSYQNDDLTLEYQGQGNWLLLTKEDDKLVRRVPYAKNRMEGLAEGFFPNGSPSFKATYKDGLLNGELVQYSRQGKVTKRMRFKDDEPVTDEESKAPQKGPSKSSGPKSTLKAL